jgi:hypothetical protein
VKEIPLTQGLVALVDDLDRAKEQAGYFQFMLDDVKRGKRPVTVCVDSNNAG